MAATCLNIQSVGVFETLITLLVLTEKDELTLDSSTGGVAPVRFSFRGDVAYFHHHAKRYTLASVASFNGDEVPLPQMDFYAFPFEDRLMVAPVSLTVGKVCDEATYSQGGRWVMRTDKMAQQAAYANLWLERLKLQHNL